MTTYTCTFLWWNSGSGKWGDIRNCSVYADVGSTDKIAEDGLQNRVVDEAVIVDIFIVDVSAATWLSQDTLKFPYKPPVNVYSTVQLLF